MKAFMDALGDCGKVISCDINPHAAALSTTHYRATSLPTTHPGHIERILNICRRFCVGLLMTLNVDELACIESCRSEFESIGVGVIGAPLESIQVARDKLATMRLCEKLGLGFPHTWTLQELCAQTHSEFPLIIKPRFGQASQGIAKLENRKELNAALSYFRDKKSSAYIIQKMLDGQEYGLDIINDLQGRYRDVLARRKLAMRGGETDIAETISSEQFEEVARSLGGHLRHQGIMDVDLMGHDGHMYVLDLNMRFGGGYAFSHLAGANVPAALMNWAQGKEADPLWLKACEGTIGARSSVIDPINVDYL